MAPTNSQERSIVPLTNLKRVDLVIPTVDRRVALLARTLEHLTEESFAGRVIVCDHSGPAGWRTVDSALTRASGLDLVHRTDPEDTHFLRRLVAGLRHSRADYAMVHADDDFAFPDAVSSCVRFLDENSDYACVQGRMAFVSVHSEEGKPIAHPFIYTRHACVAPNACDRTLQALQTFTSSLYAVHRREPLMNRFDRTLRYCEDTTFWQYLSTLLGVIDGPNGVIDCFHYLRQSHGQSWSSRSASMRDPEHPPWVLLNPRFSEWLADFRHGILHALTDIGGTASPQFSHAFDRNCLALIARILDPTSASTPEPGDVALLERLKDPRSDDGRRLRYCVKRIIDHWSSSPHPPVDG